MGGQVKVSEGHGIKTLLYNILNRKDITERFTHLGAVNHEVSVVDPVADELLPCRGLTLGNLIGMVDGRVLDAACMDVHGLPQIFHCHCGTLNMPPRKTITKLRVPVHLVIGKAANPLKPQCEIRRVFFVFTGFDSNTNRSIFLFEFLPIRSRPGIRAARSPT